MLEDNSLTRGSLTFIYKQRDFIPITSPSGSEQCNTNSTLKNKQLNITLGTPGFLWIRHSDSMDIN